MSVPSPQHLPRAPKLPPVLADVPAYVPEEPAPAADRSGTPSHADVFAAISGHRQRVTEAFLQHQRRQVAVFQASLQARERTLAALVRATHAAGPDGSAPAGAAAGTEVELAGDGWYLDSTGRVAAGLLLDLAPAHAPLLDRLGVDPAVAGGRPYRLLGCELTYHGSPPRLGDTLRTDTHLESGGGPVFAFHQECRVGDDLRLTIRSGLSGFATDEEAAARLAGVGPPLSGEGTPRRFGPEAVRAVAEGRPADCFGARWTATRAHVRTPRIDGGRLLLLREVTALDPAGGPVRRGYLRAEAQLPSDGGGASEAALLWHGCLQAMAFYLTAAGCTVDRDGWRFEPVADRPVELRFGARPGGRRVAYEVFVTEAPAGPQPSLVADVLCTVDGVPALHARGAALRLVADWPLEHWRLLGPPRVQATGEPVPLAVLGGLVGHRDESAGTVVHGYRQLLASAWGRPSEVVGDAAVDGSPRVCRLPGPPYLMVSRIVAVDGAPGELRVGTRAVAEYDVPEDVWFFEQNDCRTMPMAVLMEVVLQPCGWLAAYAGSIREGDTDLRFRNLDGVGTVLGEVRPGTRCLRSEVELLSVARQGSVVVERFGIRCLADGVPVFELTAVFGFFPQEAFDHQVGMPPSTEELSRYRRAGGDVVPLPAAGVRLAGPMLLMLDRVTGYWPDGGRAGLGLLRAEKDVDAGEWFFKCHFFQDPVWPGSLGIEAMCQLLRYYLVRRGALAGLRRPRFEPVLPGRELTWRYRGQVVPGDGLVTVEMEILEYDARGRYAVADAWLWVDGRRIYHATGLGVRVVPGDPAARAEPGPVVVDQLLEPARDAWINDHCPTWTVPTLPMMSIVDVLASAAAGHAGQDVLGVHDVQLRRWLPVEEPVRLRTELVPAPDGLRVRLLTAPEGAVEPAFEVVATGTVRLGTLAPGARPAPFPPLTGAEPAPIPYESGAIFHGPAFQYLTSVRIGPTGCTGVLDAGRGRVPRGQLNQGLLDAALHAIPHHDLSRWAPEVTDGWVGIPHRLRSLELFEPLPEAGPVVAEARFAGFATDNPLLVEIDIQLQTAADASAAGDEPEGRVLAAMRMVEILLPTVGYGAVSHADRRAFLRDRHYVNGCGLSRTVDRATLLTADEVDAIDRFPNRVAPVYGLPAGSRGSDHVAVIAAKDHVARLLKVHPSAVEVSAGLDSAEVAGHPQTRHAIHVEHDGHEVRIRSAVP